jgi:aspartyl-tRNA(Asn)/glutamyl-tRNA(Gln) amidotransferase subunit A
MKKGAKLGPLHGVPFSVKDLVITRGLATTFGTPIYRDNVTTEDAPSVAGLRRAGAIMIGKTNTPIFGWVGVTHNPLFGTTRSMAVRPHSGRLVRRGRDRGGGLAPLAIGTDGGGSIRKPAAWCGLFGLKPSYGRVPIYPHGAAWSLSHVGPMTRTVKDAALMMNAMAGRDERDQYSLPTDFVDYVKALKGSLKGLRVAYSETLGFAPAVDPEIATAAASGAREFSRFGCHVEEVNPGVQAFFNRLAWYQHPRAFFDEYDLLLSPTCANPPLPIGEYFAAEIGGVKVGRDAGSAFTFPFK